MEEFLKKNGTNIAIGLVIVVVIYFMFFNSEAFAAKSCKNACPSDKLCFNGDCVIGTNTGKNGSCYIDAKNPCAVNNCKSGKCATNTVNSKNSGCMCA